MKQNNLHCGACMEDFKSLYDLNEHLKICPAVVELLPLIYKLWLGKDNVGHPLSHFIQNLHKNAYLIKRYAYSIADEMNHFQRTKIHYELCEKLGLNYNKFLPFESSDIKNLPNKEEAEKILWKALADHAHSL